MLRQAGACRWVWNWGLARRREHFNATGKLLGWVVLSRDLTAVKASDGMEWLGEVASQPLQQTVRDLDRAFANFFAKRARYPRFKSRKRATPAFRCTESVYFIGDRLRVPKVGRVRVRGVRPLDGTPKSASFKRDASGRWFATIVVHFEMPDVPLVAPDPARVVGVDLGLKTFATLSTGEEVASPRFFETARRELALAQRRVSRRKKGSKRHAKAKARVARVHARIKDRRGDFLHKLSTRLVGEHEGIIIEDLSVRGLARTKLARGVHDAAWGEFRRQLAYKAEWHRRHFVTVDRWFPSSRLCRGCGAVNAGLTLADRRWACPSCGAEHERDHAAAQNIRDEGLRLLGLETAGSAGHAPGSPKARGRGVSPARVGSPGRTENPPASERGGCQSLDHAGEQLSVRPAGLVVRLEAFAPSAAGLDQ